MNSLNLPSFSRMLPFNGGSDPLLRLAPPSGWISASVAKVGRVFSALFAGQEAEGDKKVRSFSSSPALHDRQARQSRIMCLFVAVVVLGSSQASALCANKGAMKLPLAPTCKDSLPRGLSFEFTPEPPSSITLEKLHAAYKVGPLLGHSATSLINLVTPHGKPDERYALKTSKKPTDPLIGVQVISYLLDEGMTPHLVRTYEAHDLEPRTALEQLRKTQLLRMEWMPGDLNDFFQFSFEQRLIFALQQASTIEMLIGRFQLAPESVDLGDLFYHELTDRDCFRGQVMKEMDYWRYPVYGQVFYLPRMPYILKIGDYDSWKFFHSMKAPGRFESFYFSIDQLVDKLQGHTLMMGFPKEAIRDLLQRWSTPPPSQASLLDFGHDCLYNYFKGDLPPEPISI